MVTMKCVRLVRSNIMTRENTGVTFTIDDDALNWTGDGEYLRIEPWGTNSVRVRSRLM